MKQISINGLNLIKSFEGCRLKAYKALPSEKYYTIGYGHYGADVLPNLRITQYQAELLLLKDLARFCAAVNKYDYKYRWTQNEFDALVSFAYNIGNIDQLTAKGTRTKAQIADKIPAYCKSGKKVIPGLVRRRNAERALFLKR